MVEQQINVYQAVARAGALTTRRVITEYGPKPNWQRWIDQKFLAEVQTPYGAVLIVSPQVRAKFRAQPPPHGTPPYIAGPGAAADRAFQNDAIQVLLKWGYALHHHEFKRAGMVGSAARSKRQHTDQIVRSVMQVPPQQMRALVAAWGPGVPYQPDGWGNYPQSVGYPYLYASISSGGIKLPKLRALYGQLKNAIDLWRAPVLIAVPEDGDLRAYIRAVETKERRQFEQLVGQGLLRNRPLYPRIELIILRVP